MADETELAATVIDAGTGYVKAGMAGDQAPRKKFPNLLGKSRFTGLEVAMDQCDYVVGDEAFIKRGTLNMVEPIEKGIIKDWDVMEKVWHHTFYNELKVDPQEHPVMITDSPMNSFENKEKCTEVYFENLNVPSFFVASSAVLSLIASGNTKGVVFESGEGCTHVVPIYESYALPHSTKAMDISGRDLTNYMMELLVKSGITFSKHYDIDIVQKIKETKTHISTKFDEDKKAIEESGNARDTIFELPDGKSINIGLPQIMCPEALFQPKLIEKQMEGIHDLIYRSYFAIDMEVRKALFGKIVLSGGNTLFVNIAERIAQHMKDLGGNSINFKIYAPAERQYTAWIGGSVLSSLSTFQSMWISKRDYEEVGASIVRKKCL